MVRTGDADMPLLMLAPPSPVNSPFRGDSSPDQRRVLVVEDEPSARDAMARLFRRFGLAVETAATLAEAMDKLAQSPDFVVLDLMLPDGNGVEVLRRVRDQSLPVRVAVATGVYDWHLLDDVNKLGPDRFYRKPVDAKELVKWMTEQ